MDLDAGQLILAPRPRLRAIKTLPERGVTQVVTLLNENEGAHQIGAECNKIGLMWANFPLSAGFKYGLSGQDDFIRAALYVFDMLEDDETVFLHCAAGIHRTGMTAYGTFRLYGLTPTDAKQAVFVLRPVIEYEIMDKLEIMEQYIEPICNK